MELGTFRTITKNMPDDTYLVIVSTQDGECYVIDDVSRHPDTDVVYLEASGI